MPSGLGGMGTGSDTRMYNPRSDSARSYTGDDEEDYRYSNPDPEELEQRRDKRQKEKEAEKSKDLPHIKVEVDEPDMGMGASPMSPEPQMEDEPEMPDENEVGAEVSQLTGMPGSMGAQLDTATGARTGTGSAIGGYRPLLATGEPMQNAWSSLMKTRHTHPGESIAHFMGYNSDFADEDRMHLDRGESPLIHYNPKTGEGRAQLNPDARLYHPAIHPSHADENMFPDRKIVTRPDGTKEELVASSKHVLEDTKPVFDESGQLSHVESTPMPTFQDIPFNEETGFTKAVDIAWSSLMKRERKPFQSQTSDFEGPPGGRQPHTATSRRSKNISRVLSRYGSGGGLDDLGDEHLAVGRSHLGVSRIHPMAQSDPAEYARFQGQQQSRKIRGNVALPFSPSGTFGQRGQRAGPTGAGNIRGLAGQAGRKSKITDVQQPTMRGEPKISGSMFKSELEDLRDLLTKGAKSAENYLHFSQIRSMLRRIKDAVERNERRLKAAPRSTLHPKHGDGGHRDGGTTEPKGGTESMNPEDDTKNWGAPSTILVGRGSGRVA